MKPFALSTLWAFVRLHISKQHVAVPPDHSAVLAAMKMSFRLFSLHFFPHQKEHTGLATPQQRSRRELAAAARHARHAPAAKAAGPGATSACPRVAARLSGRNVLRVAAWRRADGSGTGAFRASNVTLRGRRTVRINQGTVAALIDFVSTGVLSCIRPTRADVRRANTHLHPRLG